MGLAEIRSPARMVTVPSVKRIAMTRRAGVALAFAVFALTAPQGARASDPTPSPAPAATIAPGLPPNAEPAPQPARAAARRSFLPIVDLVVTFTQPAYYTNASQLPAYDPLDVGGTVLIPVTRKVSLVFDRIVEGTLNQPIERSYVGPSPGTIATFPKDAREVQLQYHATYAFNRNLLLDVGHAFRHRIYGSGSGPNPALYTNISAQPFPYTISSQEHHFSFVGLNYTSRPIANLFHSVFALGETLDVQNTDHHVAALCTPPNVAAGAKCAGRTPAQVGYIDENPAQNRIWETTQSASWIVPIDPKHGTTLIVNERWGYLTFFENFSAPGRWKSALTYQISKRFSPLFTLALRHADWHASSTEGVPFTAPNSVHVGSWDVIGTFHIDLNKRSR